MTKTFNCIAFYLVRPFFLFNNNVHSSLCNTWLSILGQIHQTIRSRDYTCDITISNTYCTVYYFHNSHHIFCTLKWRCTSFYVNMAVYGLMSIDFKSRQWSWEKQCNVKVKHFISCGYLLDHLRFKWSLSLSLPHLFCNKDINTNFLLLKIFQKMKQKNKNVHREEAWATVIF